MADQTSSFGKADIVEAKEADALLKSDASGDSVASTARCEKLKAIVEENCPSCGKPRTASELATKLAYAERHASNPPDNYKKKLDEEGGFGSSDAHCIVAQSQLRTFTRRLLEEFYSMQKETTPCIFADDRLWKSFKDEYVARALKAFSAPIPREDIKSWLDKKHSEYDFWREDYLKVNPLFLELYQMVAARPGGRTGPVEDSSKIGTPEQRQTFGRFKQLFKSDSSVAWADGDPKIAGEADGTVVMTGTVLGDSDGSKIAYKAIVDANGTRLTYEKTTTIGLSTSKPEDLLTPTAITAKPPWAGRIFEGIMGSPFTQGSQCRYCEEIQGDGSLIQRMAYFESLTEIEKKANVEFVGQHLLTLQYKRRSDSEAGPKDEIVKCKDATDFVRNWMEDVAVELRERLRVECKNNLNEKMVDAKEPYEMYKGNFVRLTGEMESSAKAWVEGRKPGSADAAFFSDGEMDEAIRLAMLDLKPGVEYGENAIKGMIRKRLSDPAKKIDNKAFDTKVALLLSTNFTRTERETKKKEIEVKYKLK